MELTSNYYIKTTRTQQASLFLSNIPEIKLISKTCIFDTKSKKMGLALEKNHVNYYFSLIKGWDMESKKDLIFKLTQSMHKTEEESHDFSACFGAWDDERSADEIINDIRNSRINNREIENF